MVFFKNLLKPDPEVDYQLALKSEMIEHNFEKAAWLYEKAANQGHAGAEFYCCYMYLKGRGIKKDNQKALDYLNKAARQNQYKAQYLLAQMYYSGEGVEKDIEEGNKWMEKFNEHGEDSSKLSFLNLP